MKKNMVVKCIIFGKFEMAECESPYFGLVRNAGHNATRLAYDLGSLKHLQEYL
jgi:hypothetical protein